MPVVPVPCSMHALRHACTASCRVHNIAVRVVMTAWWHASQMPLVPIIYAIAGVTVTSVRTLCAAVPHDL